MAIPKFRDLSIGGAIVAAYVIFGKIGLLFAYAQPNATAIWAPTGIAIAALLILGYRFWPAIFIGAFITNLLTPGTPVLASLLIGIGNTLEAVLAVYLTHKFAGGLKAFDRAKDVLRFSFLAGIVSTMISPLIGVAALSLSGASAWSNYASVWVTWWMGDVAGGGRGAAQRNHRI
jgi:integral membrane sensor domain MASE1